MWKRATVLEQKRDRSYVIKTDHGQVTRNRVHLRKCHVARDAEYDTDGDDIMQTQAPSPRVEADDEQVQNEHDFITHPEDDGVPEPSQMQPSPMKTRSGRIVKKPSRYDDYV